MNNDNERAMMVEVPTSDAMHRLGFALAKVFASGDVVLLSGPLGAGKTTLAQGIGKGLKIKEPIVSPTFTIARELSGRFADDTPARLVHVDAYRIGGVEHAPGSDVATALLDELESLGLDEELENPSEGTVVLMEWGEHMAGILADERLEISIDRSLALPPDAQQAAAADLTSNGMRHVELRFIGAKWNARRARIQEAVKQIHE
jgi:tRNA threonylcarbamoyladenosine biosynthesis protein TsaE